jgi:hypothetical protein
MDLGVRERAESMLVTSHMPLRVIHVDEVCKAILESCAWHHGTRPIQDRAIVVKLWMNLWIET